jgi:hypothetical protein
MRAPLALLAVLASAPAAAERAPDGPPEVRLALDDTVDVCALARCPPSGVFCYDPALVAVEHAGGTVRLRALKAGATLCAIQQADTTRRVVKVVVEGEK